MRATLSALVALLVLAPATAAQAASPDIVISQVYGGGGNSGAPFTNDFIELFNRGTATVDVDRLERAVRVCDRDDVDADDPRAASSRRAAISSSVRPPVPTPPPSCRHRMRAATSR